MTAMKKEIYKEQHGEGYIENKGSSEDKIVSSSSVTSSSATISTSLKPNLMSTRNI